MAATHEIDVELTIQPVPYEPYPHCPHQEAMEQEGRVLEMDYGRHALLMVLGVGPRVKKSLNLH